MVDRAQSQREWMATYREQNLEAVRARDRAYYHANKERKHDQMRQRKFGISGEEYASLLAAQGGGCAICGSKDPGGKKTNFQVDHDHACCPANSACGRCVRGLLCFHCNLVLGHAADEPARLLAAANYLESRVVTSG